MRASLYLIGFAAASIVAAGVVEVGCSSSSTPATPPVADAETPATDAPAAATDSSTPAEAAACVPMSTNSETFDSGSSTWAALQTACATSLTACAANCECNNAILQALVCSQADAALATGCFTTALTAIATSDPTDESAVGACLIANTGMSPEGGADSGTTSDAEADAGVADAAGGG
jgi:hypothetical protein